jgi:transcription elongation factor GreA-like protein
MAYFLQGLFGIDNEDTLSKIKSFLDDLTIPKGKWKSWYQNAQAQKFIKKNFPIKSYDEIKRGDKIWLF